MSEQNAITVKPNTTLATLPEDKQVAEFYKMTLPYGQNLTDNNAIALAQYCRVFGLSAQNGEAYFLVRVDANSGKRTELGLYPGIRAWRKKAKEHLEAIDRQATYKIDYEIVDASEVGLKRENVAICIRATLRDDVSRMRHLKDFIELLKAGLKREEIDEVIGKPPVWVGYGTVKASEVSYLKMEPRRVAEKRAEKDATSRRFDLPFGDQPMADEVEVESVDVEYKDVTNAPKTNGKPKRSEAELMSELTGEPITTTVKDEAPDDGEWMPADELEADTAMTYEEASTVTDKRGKLYIEAPTEALEKIVSGLELVLETANLTPEYQAETRRRLEAVTVIAAYRASNPQ